MEVNLVFCFVVMCLIFCLIIVVLLFVVGLESFFYRSDFISVYFSDSNFVFFNDSKEGLYA